jgi:hypothetical protein
MGQLYFRLTGVFPKNIEEWNERFLAPLGGALKRYPKGRKGYNLGRMMKSSMALTYWRFGM